MNQFDKDERMVTLKHLIVVLILCLISFLICQKVKAQSIKDAINLYNSDGIITTNIDSPPFTRYIAIEEKDRSDTTEVVYVLLKEDYMEQINNDYTIDTIAYPYLEVIYGYHIQHRKPYRVEFLDSHWNLINEDDLLYIKKRKLFKTNK